MVIDPEIPTAVPSERAVIGAMLQAPQAVAEARSLLTGVEFYQPRHERIFATMCALHDGGAPVEPTSVARVLIDQGDIGLIGGATYLLDCMRQVQSATQVGWYAEEVRWQYQRRQFVEVATRLAQVASVDGNRPDVLAGVAQQAQYLDLAITGSVSPTLLRQSFAEFHSRYEERRWVIPGLLEAQEVFLVVSAPGGGKSWLSRQIVQCVAAGMHPFKPEQMIPPKRCLLVDLENPPATTRAQNEPLHRRLTQWPTWDDRNAAIITLPGGLDLRSAEGARVLEQEVADFHPDLVALGSLYRAGSRGSDGWDEAAEDLIRVFDRLRERYGVALWLEHHMPKGASNPYGDSRWEWWPGFGRVLRRVAGPVYELDASFRGDRDQREIPAGLERGGILPWSALWDEQAVEYRASQF